MNSIRKLALLAGSAVVGCGMFGAPGVAFAAEAEKAASPNVSEVIVTGTRITTQGYEAPTPVTVLSADDLLRATPSNMIDALNQTPQFLGSTTPSSQGGNFSNSPRGNFLNLRGLGAKRILILVDGVRVPPTNFTNTTNIDYIPQIMVQRVDVVTAGASAAYGSDALSGAVNFILNHKLEGVKGVVDGGMSDGWEHETFHTAVAVGRQVSERLHLTATAEYSKFNRLARVDRPLNGKDYISYTFTGKNVGAGTPGTAINPYILIPETNQLRSNFTPVTGLFVTGPAVGQTFNADGTLRPYNSGRASGTPGVSIGGDGGSSLPVFFALNAPYNTYHLYSRADLDVTDNITAFASASYNHYHEYNTGSGSALSNVPLFSGNPYLPASIQSQLTANQQIGYSISPIPAVFSLSETGEAFDDRYISFSAGIEGKADKWTWRANYAFGQPHSRSRQFNQIDNKALFSSIDAVRAPDGSIVCRITLTNPTVAPGCVPWNVLGETALKNTSAAVKKYVYRTVEYSTQIDSHELSFDISGEPFSTWAGPVGMTVGALYRQQELTMKSNSDPLTNPTDFTGIRGTSVNTAIFFTNSQAVGQGTIKVKEAFGEVAIPLLKEAPLAYALDFNAAGRVTDYNTSGRVETWKVGGVYQPIEDVRARVTLSRDIRAPAVFELFQGANSSTGGVVLDPHTQAALIIPQRLGGNPNLKPEIGKTLTFGFTFQPRAIPRFRLAVDYYDVRVSDAIGQIPSINLLRACEVTNGVGTACDLITRPLPFSDRSVNNFPTLVQNTPVNISKLKTTGIDIEAAYSLTLGPGDLNLHFNGTYIDKYITQLDPSSPRINYAGYTETASGGGAASGIPKFRAQATANYVWNDWSFFVQERYISRLKYGPVFIYEYPNVPRVFYTDVTVTRNFKVRGADFSAYIAIKDLFNKRPPIIPLPTPLPALGYSTQQALYDVDWRAFTVGLKFQF